MRSSLEVDVGGWRAGMGAEGGWGVVRGGGLAVSGVGREGAMRTWL